jgi:predicted Zn-dependent peptidase
MLFKGTARRTAKEISESIEGIGGYLNAFTAEESTCFYARASHDRLEELLDVLVDMLLGSRFAPADVSKERQVIKEELAMYLDEPQHQVQELLNATLWPRHPLGRPITGTPRSLDALRRPELLNCLHRNYVASSVVITAAGRVTHSALIRMVKRYAHRFFKGTSPLFTPAREEQAAARVSLITRKIEQTQIALGIRTCSRIDERRYAIRLLNTILGENMSSRLFQVLREDRGLAYSIYSTPSHFADTGDLVISAGLDPEKVTKAVSLIVREMKRLREKPPAKVELQRARDYVIGQIELAAESTESQMNWLGEQLIGYGKLFSLETIKHRLKSVSPAEIQSVARDFFRSDKLNLAVVSPMKSIANLSPLLNSSGLS